MKSHYHHVFIDARSIMIPAFYSNQEKFFGLKTLFRMIASSMNEFRPQTMCIVFGDQVSNSKREFYSKYSPRSKERRSEADANSIGVEIETAQTFLKNCPVRQIFHPGIEAKDAIAYLSKILKRPKIVISSSKDYFQILCPDLQIMEPKDGLIISDLEADAILGFSHEFYLLWKCIVGDPQMNTYGIKRIGRERATRLIQHTIRTGQKFPLNPSEQKILDRNKYLFSIGEVLTKEERHELLKLYQFERTKPLVGVFKEFDPSTFGIQNEIKEIFRLSNEIRHPKVKREGVTLQ